MVGNDRIQTAVERLAAEGIEVSVQASEGVLVVRVVASERSEPETWLRVFREFKPLNCGVEIY